MSTNIIINIPHSSCYIPDFYLKKIIINKEYFQQELKLLTDSYTDDLFENNRCNILKSEISRIVCDVERFRNDEDESMSSIGMGAVYTKTVKGDKLIEIDNNYKEFILTNYYDKYHNKLNQLTTEILEENKKCVIIDAHSFSKELIEMLKGKQEKIPDVCIGFDKDFYDSKIVNTLKEHFESKGYSVAYNNPYSGAIVPNMYYDKKDARVKSVMIEINKSIYLDENGEKSNNYLYVKSIIQEAIEKIIALENKEKIKRK